MCRFRDFMHFIAAPFEKSQRHVQGKWEEERNWGKRNFGREKRTNQFPHNLNAQSHCTYTSLCLITRGIDTLVPYRSLLIHWSNFLRLIKYESKPGFEIFRVLFHEDNLKDIVPPSSSYPYPKSSPMSRAIQMDLLDYHKVQASVFLLSSVSDIFLTFNLKSLAVGRLPSILEFLIIFFRICCH